MASLTPVNGFLKGYNEMLGEDPHYKREEDNTGHTLRFYFGERT